MKEKLTNNLSLKIIAVLFAAGLWMISININDPYQSKDYSVAVQLQNMNVMTAAGKYVEVLDHSDEISVRVRGNRSVMDTFSASNISATADLNELDENNQMKIKLSTVKTSDSKIESIRSNDTLVTVKVEDIAKVQKKIEIETKNVPAKGYILGKTSTEQNALSISGPESLVDTVDKAVVKIDLEGAKDDVSMILPIELYDAEGRQINDTRLSTSIGQVQCVAAILETKEVPVKAVIKGTAAKGYGAVGAIAYEPSTVLIAGRSSAVKNVNEIQITEPVDIGNAVEDVTEIVELKKYLPENVVTAAASFDGKVKITVEIEKEETKIFELTTDKIAIVNVPEGITARVADPEEVYEIEITGYESVMSEFDEKDLTAQIDLQDYDNENGVTGKEDEIRKTELTFELPDGMWIKEAVQAEIKIIRE